MLLWWSESVTVSVNINKAQVTGVFDWLKLYREKKVVSGSSELLVMTNGSKLFRNAITYYWQMIGR